MRYLSVCSGIEAASVAWQPLGWEPVAFSEIDKFPAAVLAHHYPAVPNWGDMTKCEEWPDAAIDVLVGGTPCQSFSVAGLRKGLADPRGNLMLTYLAIAGRYRPDWLVWENVPGVLSQDGGRSFGTFLGALGQLGYGFAYRVLDAQYFGLAQRRKRVFVVASARGWASATAVLFERASLSGHPAPSREPREGATYDVAPSFTSSGRGVARCGESRGQDPVIAMCLNAGAMGRGDADCFGAHAGAYIPLVGNTLTARMSKGVNSTLDESQTPVVCFHPTQDPITSDAGVTHCLSGGSARGQASVAVAIPTAQTIQVRRLTPRECERLQGFPDDYTQIPYRGKPAADGPRYQALGNSMAVPVVRWIGERLPFVDQLRD